jgi:transcriptional regulator with XRE-family HTH domain
MAHGAAVSITDYTTAHFSEALGIEEPRYRRWERGEVEPSLGELANIQRVTGISLDMLITGREPWRFNSIPKQGHVEGEFTLGDRLRLAREIREPDPGKVANLIDVSLAEWVSWESGAVQPPIGEMLDFCSRWGVSLDYIYRGLMQGVSLDIGLVLTKVAAAYRTAAGARVRGSRRAERVDKNTKAAEPDVELPPSTAASSTRGA